MPRNLPEKLGTGALQLVLATQLGQRSSIGSLELCDHRCQPEQAFEVRQSEGCHCLCSQRMASFAPLSCIDRLRIVGTDLSPALDWTGLTLHEASITRSHDPLSVVLSAKWKRPCVVHRLQSLCSLSFPEAGAQGVRGSSGGDARFEVLLTLPGLYARREVPLR